MVPSSLAIARDCAILLLSIEIFIILLLPIFALWHVTRWLREFIPQVARALEEVRAGWFRLVLHIQLILDRIRGPFIWIASKGEGLRVFLSRMKST